MFEMSAFNFDARRESLAKAQNRLAVCFIRQIIPDSLHSRFGYARLCGFGFSLLKLTRIIYYYSILNVHKIFCHNDVPTKVVVAARVSLIKPTCCSVEKSVLRLRHLA